jgi:hypothetical protein
MSNAARAPENFEEGKAYPLTLLRECGVKLVAVAVRRKGGYSFRLFREENAQRFWVEGPYGEKSRTAYLFLGSGPLRQGVTKQAGAENFWKSLRHPGAEPPPEDSGLWIDRYPSFALLGGEHDDLNRKIVYQYGLWKQNLFFFLGLAIVVGYWVLDQAGYGGLENLLAVAFGGMALFFVGLTFYLTS